MSTGLPNFHEFNLFQGQYNIGEVPSQTVSTQSLASYLPDKANNLQHYIR